MKLVIFMFGSVIVLNECVAEKLVPQRPLNTIEQMEKHFFENLDKIPEWTEDEPEIKEICKMVFSANCRGRMRYEEILKDVENCKIQPLGKQIVKVRRISAPDQLRMEAPLMYCKCEKLNVESRPIAIVKNVQPNSYFLLFDHSVFGSVNSFHYHIINYLVFEEANDNSFWNMLKSAISS